MVFTGWFYAWGRVAVLKNKVAAYEYSKRVNEFHFLHNVLARIVLRECPPHKILLFVGKEDCSLLMCQEGGNSPSVPFPSTNFKWRLTSAMRTKTFTVAASLPKLHCRCLHIHATWSRDVLIAACGLCLFASFQFLRVLLGAYKRQHLTSALQQNLILKPSHQHCRD